MGVTKQIPQLQPKAKERNSINNGCGRGWVCVGAVFTGQRKRTSISIQTCRRKKLNEKKLGRRGKVRRRGSKREHGKKYITKTLVSPNFKYVEVLNL